MSISILTHNRPGLLRKSLNNLSTIDYAPLEILVVDNGSTPPAAEMLGNDFPRVTIIELENNVGAVGRNYGMKEASGDIVITLDDDIIGIDRPAIDEIVQTLRNTNVGAVCFKVVDAETGGVVNWCHHYPVERYCDRVIRTNEITEGAVAFRKEALERVGLYPEAFFVSHEGPDIAFRLINAGYDVLYIPNVVVRHYHSQEGREPWRRYYYDTRNVFWLAARNFPLAYGIKRVVVGVIAMLIFSVRDGFFRYWVKGVIDGISGLHKAYQGRRSPRAEAMSIVKEIESHRPGVLYMLRKRIFRKGVQI